MNEAFVVEGAGFRELHDLAIQMIVDRAPGVSGDGDGAYITSFDAFFDYVARKRPEIVSKRDAPNPFPGILPAGKYGRLTSIAASGDELLICSERVYHRTTRFQYRITCGGSVKAVK